jgi:RNA polymerase sigma-70 factor (ECF subfamily)
MVGKRGSKEQRPSAEDTPGHGADRERDGSFDEFFRREYRAIVKAVMYAGAGLEDAEDSASTAMIEAYLSWSLLVNPVAWVRTAAIHNFVHNVRRERKRPALETRATRLDRALSPPTADEGDDGLVVTALRGLPPAQRTVMALVLDGYEPVEIAELLGTIPDTVRSNLRHAKHRLRCDLRDFDGTTGSSIRKASDRRKSGG